MKDIQSREKFIELRALGLSFEKIAQEIGVSKPTLIKWNRECSKEVANLMYFNSEKLIEQYKLLKIHKIETLANTLNRILDEVQKRNFENVSTKDLISIAFTIEGKLKENVADIRLYTGVTEEKFGIEKMFEEKTEPLLY
jgi:DNA-binding XRE family transcriptional regulator